MNEKKIQIRKGIKESEYFYLLENGYPFSPQYIDPKSDNVKTRFLKVLNRLTGYPYSKFSYIALNSNTKPVGCITYYPFKQNIWFTGPLYVDQNSRGLGIGKMLIQKANEELRQKKIRKAFGDVPINNPSYFLHKNLGAYFIDNTIRFTPKESLDCGKNLEISLSDVTENTLNIYNTQCSESWISFYHNKKIEINPHNSFLSWWNPRFYTQKVVKLPKSDSSFGIIFSSRFSNHSFAEIYSNNFKDTLEIINVITNLKLSGIKSFWIKFDFNEPDSSVSNFLDELKLVGDYTVTQTMIYEFNY